MLKKLRVRITVLAALLTGTVLAGVMAFAYKITQDQYQNSQRLAFDSAVDQVEYQWNRFNTLEDDRLLKLQNQSGICIYLEENGQPLLYSRRTEWGPVLQAAKQNAWQQKKMDCNAPPIPGLSVQRADFWMDEEGNAYRCSARILAPQPGKWTLLLAVQDTKPESIYCTRLALTFLAVLVGGLLILAAACWFVAGRAIEPIRDSMQYQQQFLSAAGHELRTPLAVIRANVGAALRQPQKTERYLKAMDEESARMGSLVDELLLLSAGASARQRLTMEPLEPDTFLLDFAEGMEPLAAEKERRLEVELPEDAVPPILADGYRLRQLLTILVDNALRYAPQNTAVTLRLQVVHRRVCFWVIDHGDGVADKDKKRIFERFASTQNKADGRQHYGLGLSVAKELTKLHGAKIWVQDTPGKGASFCVSFKAAR